MATLARRASHRKVTGAPVKFVGLGEKYDALEGFYPRDRLPFSAWATSCRSSKK